MAYFVTNSTILADKNTDAAMGASSNGSSGPQLSISLPAEGLMCNWVVPSSGISRGWHKVVGLVEDTSGNVGIAENEVSIK